MNTVELSDVFNRDKVFGYKNKSRIVKMTWKELNEIKNQIIIPNIQGTLNRDKIEEMKKSYELNPHYLAAKCLLVIAHTKIGQTDKYYLVDGQHRFHTAIELFQTNKSYNDTFLVSIVDIDNFDDMLLLFSEINADSSKCVIKKSTFKEFELANYYEVKKLIGAKYTFLPKSSSVNKTLYTISEFIEILIQSNAFAVLKITKKTPEEILKFLENKENEFFSASDYLEQYHKNKDKFREREQVCIENQSCMFMKANNFITWLLNPGVQVTHDFVERKSISKSLKNKVWEKEFGSKTSGSCPIYSCNNILSLDVSNSWQCGHLCSVKNKGETVLENLRPICTPCNQSMGETNWDKWLDKKMRREIIDDYFDDSIEEIKCKIKNCKQKINANNFKPWIFESSKNKPKPICADCYEFYK